MRSKSSEEQRDKMKKNYFSNQIQRFNQVQSRVKSREKKIKKVIFLIRFMQLFANETFQHFVTEIDLKCSLKNASNHNVVMTKLQRKISIEI